MSRIKIKEVKGAMPVADIRGRFETSIKNSPRLAGNTPLGVMEINGAFSHYMDPDTDTMWLGFALGTRLQEREQIVSNGKTEPVAQELHTALISLLRTIRPEYGMVGSRDVDVAAQQKHIDRVIALLNATPVREPGPATERVGSWLSVALADPTTCQEMRDDILAWMAAGQPNVQPITPPLAADHQGMRVDYSGLLKQAQEALAGGNKEPGLAEMLRQLQNHMSELGRRWCAGDATVIDEFLQLYCVEQDKRDICSGASTAVQG